MSRTKGSKNKTTSIDDGLKIIVEPESVRITRDRNLTRYELETVINLNKEDNEAVVFTYEKTWQKHIEKRMGIKPYLDNGYGGKSYRIPKNRIRKPLSFRVGKKKPMTEEHKAKLLAGKKLANNKL